MKQRRSSTEYDVRIQLRIVILWQIWISLFSYATDQQIKSHIRSTIDWSRKITINEVGYLPHQRIHPFSGHLMNHRNHLCVCVCADEPLMHIVCANATEYLSWIGPMAMQNLFVCVTWTWLCTNHKVTTPSWYLKMNLCVFSGKLTHGHTRNATSHSNRSRFIRVTCHSKDGMKWQRFGGRRRAEKTTQIIRFHRELTSQHTCRWRQTKYEKFASEWFGSVPIPFCRVCVQRLALHVTVSRMIFVYYLLSAADVTSICVM